MGDSVNLINDVLLPDTQEASAIDNCICHSDILVNAIIKNDEWPEESIYGYEVTLYTNDKGVIYICEYNGYNGDKKGLAFLPYCKRKLII